MSNKYIKQFDGIPSDWGVLKTRHIGLFSSSGIDKKIESDEALIKIVNYLDVYKNEKKVLYNSDDYMVVSTKKEKIAKHTLKKGDMLFTPSSETVDDIGLSAVVMEDLNNTCFSYHLLRLTFKKNINTNYKKYLFNNHLVYSYFSSVATGTTRMTLDLNKFKEAQVILPPEDIQKKIATVLDNKCSIIDSEIEKNNKSIELMEEYRKSIINSAVIPKENWKVERLKYHFSFRKGLSITKEDLVEEGVPVINYGQIHSKQNSGIFVHDELLRFVPEKYMDNSKSLVKSNDFIFADTSEDLEGTGNNIYIDYKDNLFAGYHTIILSPKEEANTKFFAYLFKSEIWRSQLRKRVFGVKIYSITQKILKECDINIPPPEEQKEIAKYLDNKCELIDKVIDYRKQIIEKLEEYKKSLIYEVVTGKVEV